MLFFSVALTAAGGCAHPRGAVLYAPPSLLFHTTPDMRTAGFWIGRHRNPDVLVLSPENILRFNAHLRDDLKFTSDLSAWPVLFPGKELRAELESQFKKHHGLLFLDGTRPAPAYWEAMRGALHLEAIPEYIPRHYGLIVRYAGQRLLPTDDGLYAQAYDEDFDELQNSALDIATPVVIRHRSLDGEWVFVSSNLSSGWVRARDVALAGEEQMRYFWSAPFVVVTLPKADIYLDQHRTQFYGAVRMGVRLPAGAASYDAQEILLPRRQSDGTVLLGSAFVNAADVQQGYLAYTPRNVLTQAFKMIHQPYGWGGMYGGQDCSRFLQEVFATVGIELPRNSSAQIQAGEALADWQAPTPGEEKLRVLNTKDVGGMAILGMKGHILLYLGSVDGRAYAIHSLWAYRRPRGGRDETFVVNRVAVSDLTLGEGSRRGSLLERLNAVRIVAY